MECPCAIKGSYVMVHIICGVLYKMTRCISRYFRPLCDSSASLVFLDSFIGGTESMRVKRVNEKFRREMVVHLHPKTQL